MLFTEMGKIVEGAKFGGEGQRFIFGHITFEMSVRYSSRVGRGCRGIYEAGVRGRQPRWKYTFRKYQHIVGI